MAKNANDDKKDETTGEETQTHVEPVVEPATPPAAPSGGASSDLGDMAAELVGAMPGVSEHVIEQRAQEQAAAQSVVEKAAINAAGNVDRHGASFDPSVHVYDELTGDVPLTASGKLRMAKTGRKKKNAPSAQAAPQRATHSQVNINGPAQATTAPDVDGGGLSVDQRIEARTTGTQTAGLLIITAVTLGGEDFLPRKDAQVGLDEQANLEKVFADYFEATGKTDLPPGVALTIGIAGYVLPRFAMPKTKTRVQRAGLWFRERMQRIRRPKMKRGQVDVPNSETNDAA